MSETAIERLTRKADHAHSEGWLNTEKNLRNAIAEGEEAAERYLNMMAAVGKAAKSIRAREGF